MRVEDKKAGSLIGRYRETETSEPSFCYSHLARGLRVIFDYKGRQIDCSMTEKETDNLLSLINSCREKGKEPT